MRILFAIVIGLCLTGQSLAADFEPFAGPKPLVVLINSDPWAMVIGSDTPRVVVYEDGEVIFAKRTKEGLAYHHLILDQKALGEVHERLKPVLALKDLKPHYDMRPGWTDQPMAMLYIRDGARAIATTVYGLRDSSTPLAGGGASELPAGLRATAPPRELLGLHEWLCQLDYRNSQAWTPRYIEVMLWDYSYAPDPSTQWPAGWPGLHSTRTIKRGDAYSIFLDGTQLSALREFLATLKPKGAVEVDGKKMAASWRYTFPSEPIWRGAFEKNGTQ